MPDQPVDVGIPAHKADTEQPVSEIREVLLPWEKTWKETRKKLASFHRTRRRVLAGAPLYDRMPGELAAEGLQTPLKFHLYQIVLAALPATALIQAWTFVNPIPIDEFLEGSEAIYESHFVFWASVLNPISIPVVLLAYASATAWASLRRRDSSRASRARARRAVHYLAGTRQLFPAMTLSLAAISVPIVLSAPVSDSARWTISVVLVFLTLAVVLRALWLGVFVIPEQLFRINGYGVEPVRTTETTWGYVNPPSWTKFRVAAILFVLVGSPLILATFSRLVEVLAYLTSAFQIWISGANY